LEKDPPCGNAHEVKPAKVDENWGSFDHIFWSVEGLEITYRKI